MSGRSAFLSGAPPIAAGLLERGAGQASMVVKSRDDAGTYFRPTLAQSALYLAVQISSIA